MILKLLLPLLLVSLAYARGTSAGTVITNVATLDFVVDETPEQIESNVVTDTVAQLIDLHIDNLDTGDIHIKQNIPTPPLSFKIANTGNGKDRFLLRFDVRDKSDFRLHDIKCYVDENHNHQFDNQDREINRIDLKADETATFFLVAQGPDESEIPTTHNHCYITVKGISLTGGSGIAGKVYPGKGVGGVDAVDGEKGGVTEAEGVWEYVSKKVLLIHQKSTVQDPFGGSEPVSGALITYDITVSAGKHVHAKDVTYKNPVPKHTLYQKNSIRLNGKSLTDNKDSDNGYFDTKNNLIIVDLDHIKNYETKKIRFQVKIQ